MATQLMKCINPDIYMNATKDKLYYVYAWHNKDHDSWYADFTDDNGERQSGWDLDRFEFVTNTGNEEAREAANDNTNPKDRLGIAKPGFTAIPGSALIHLGQAMENGRGKYGLYNWREKDVKASIYVDAAMRHLLSWWDGEERAKDSAVQHLGHVMACCAILLDAIETGKLVDDRGIPGGFSDLIDRETKK